MRVNAFFNLFYFYFPLDKAPSPMIYYKQCKMGKAHDSPALYNNGGELARFLHSARTGLAKSCQTDFIYTLGLVI